MAGLVVVVVVVVAIGLLAAWLCCQTLYYGQLLVAGIGDKTNPIGQLHLLASSCAPVAIVSIQLSYKRALYQLLDACQRIGI